MTAPHTPDWVRRFIAAPARLDEICQLYKSLGYEVRLEPMTEADLQDECGDCRLALAFFKTVYTRPARIRQ